MKNQYNRVTKCHLPFKIDGTVLFRTKRLHNEIVTENIRSETIRLEGGHYLHFEQTEEIAKEIREWIIVEKMIYR